MSEKTTGEDMLFEHDPKGAFAQFVAPWPATESRWLRSSGPPSPSSTRANPRASCLASTDVTSSTATTTASKSASAASCAPGLPADAIFVEAASNTPDGQYSAGERYGRVYQINYLRCIFCGMCIEACPTRALTMTNDFEIAKYTREDDIYEKEDLLVPLSDGMLAAPHPMVEGKNDIDYYRGDVTGPTATQVDWVAARRPDDPSLKTVRVAKETH